MHNKTIADIAYASQDKATCLSEKLDKFYNFMTGVRGQLPNFILYRTVSIRQIAQYEL